MKSKEKQWKAIKKLWKQMKGNENCEKQWKVMKSNTKSLK